MGGPDLETLHRSLLRWFRERQRDLPFRRTRDPYAILVAEVLLQRTRVKAGLPYYERFLAAFPTVRDLAAAPEADVLRVWEGLGFYGRARNLHRAAKAIAEGHGGRVPRDMDALRALPGVGDYTAGAVASIAFGARVPAVDGNAARVLARLYRVEADVTGGEGRRRIRALAASLVHASDPGAWNQALMELGSTVCTPRAPRCPTCPVSGACASFATGSQEEIPWRPRRSPTPVVPVVFVIVRRGDAVLLVRRDRGLHAGMYGLLGGGREADESEEDAVRRHLRGHRVRPERLARVGPVRHAFSHLRWEGAAYACVGRGRPVGAEWVPRDRLGALPLVPLHRRLLDRAI